MFANGRRPGRDQVEARQASVAEADAQIASAQG